MQNEKGESLFDALTAGLAPEGETEETETEVEETTDTGEEGGEAPADEETEVDEGDEAPEGEETETEEEGEEDAEAAAAAAAAATAKKPEADDLEDPIPKGTLERTQTRIKNLIERVKTSDTSLQSVTQERDAAVQQRDELIGEITGTGMDGPKFAVMLDYARGVNSNDPEMLENSYNIMMSELKGLSARLGKPMPGENPIAAHADLMAAIEKKEITPQLALETALQRNRVAAFQKLQAAGSAASHGAQQHQFQAKEARSALSTLGKELAAKDGAAEYKRKAQIVVDMFLEADPKAIPSVKAFRAAYSRIPAAAAPVKKAVVPPKKGAPQQPLRGNKRPAGSGQAQPKSLQDVVRMAVNSTNE